MKTLEKTREPEQFEDRIRFNWGYHDARFDAKNHLTNRETINPGRIDPGGQRPLPWKDEAYCEGYIRGYESNLEDADHRLSNGAWANYQAS